MNETNQWISKYISCVKNVFSLQNCTRRRNWQSCLVERTLQTADRTYRKWRQSNLQCWSGMRAWHVTCHRSCSGPERSWSALLTCWLWRSQSCLGQAAPTHWQWTTEDNAEWTIKQSYIACVAGGLGRCGWTVFTGAILYWWQMGDWGLVTKLWGGGRGWGEGGESNTSSLLHILSSSSGLLAWWAGTGCPSSVVRAPRQKNSTEKSAVCRSPSRN